MWAVLGVLGLMWFLLVPPPGVVGSAWAGLEEAEAAYKRGDYARALRELRPLGERGDARAQVALGVLYQNGQGVSQDYAEAVKWYRRAAEQGDASAQYALGAVYHNGDGVRQDYAEAAKWYRRAADQGAASAQYNLGRLYATGRGVPEDYVLAHMWLDLAASAEARDLVAARMTPAQLAEALRRAQEWKPRPEAGGK